jgi:DNA polymerase
MSDSGDTRQELTELVRHARAWVEWLKDSGLEEAHLEGDADALLAAPRPGARAGARRRAASAATPPAARKPAAPAARGRAAAPAQHRAPTPDSVTAKGAPEGGERAEPARRDPARDDDPAQDDPAERHRRLAVLAEEVSMCTKCRLHESRTHTAFARGNPDGDIVFIGEGPGFQEDQQGIPFVGKAGQLLDKMIAAMGYDRDDVYIANIVKCRPPDNRKPEPDEVAACAPYLEEQLSLVRPKVMVALGATGVQGLIGTTMGITRMRGKWKLYKGRIPLMPTFHPAYLLRQPAKKRDVWNDLKQVMKRLGKEPPSGKGSGKGSGKKKDG